MRISLVLLALVLAPRLAAAHQTSVKYVDLALDGARVEIAIQLAPGDVTEAMGLAADAMPRADEAARHPAVPPYVQRWLALTADGRPCTPDAASARADGAYLHVTWTADCARDATPGAAGRAIEALSLDFAAFFALDSRHEAIVRMRAPAAEPVQTIVRAGESPVVLRAGYATSPLVWIRSGMDHIWGGLDHVCFVLALLLVVVLERRGGAWHVRALVPALKSTAVVVTAFTIAHSLTLIAASLGWVELPSRLVESLIALSIAYTALEDIARPDARWRFALTFAFGLVHGLGFASQLAVLLPPRDVVVPLLCFNLGVELGQLAIVAVALPALLAFARGLGAERYRWRALPVIAGLLVALGLVMAVERVLSVSLLPT